MPDRWRRFFIAKEFISVPSMTHFRNYSISKLSQYSRLTFGFVMAVVFEPSVACDEVIFLLLKILRLRRFVHSISKVSLYTVIIFGFVKAAYFLDPALSKTYSIFLLPKNLILNFDDSYLSSIIFDIKSFTILAINIWVCNGCSFWTQRCL